LLLLLLCMHFVILAHFLVPSALCRLAGNVHAGCDGDRSATISALELRGAHLVIANVKSLAAARVSSVLRKAYAGMHWWQQTQVN
jgi:septum formation inhibitor MinC